MAVVALIVAVQKYPNASGLAGELPGTNDAAKTFCNWLAEKKGVIPKGDPNYDPKKFFCCAGEEVPFRTHGTTRPEIVRAIQDLEKAAKDNTDELYCYFGGHGFCYPRDEIVQEDIFVASDFESLRKSGAACLKLKEVMDLLTPALGPSDQYYFFDACRTEVKFGEVRPTDMGITFERSQLGYGGKAVLFSIEQGLAARTDSRFSEHLVDGLYGKGRAKGWYNESLYVKFEFLWNYVQAKIKKKVSHSIGESEGLILKIDPVPKQRCLIRVADADASDKFTYTVKRRKTVVTTGEFQGIEHTIEIDEPGEYEVELKQPGALLVRLKPPPPAPIDLYDPAEVQFRKEPIPKDIGLEGMLSHYSTAPKELEHGTLSIQGIPNAVIRLKSALGDWKVDGLAESMTKRVAPGIYHVELEERGDVVARQKVVVTAGEKLNVDLVPKPPNLQKAILAHVAPEGGRAVFFSESLGSPTADRDLGLWLAFLGASRIVGQKREFPKLSQVPLAAEFDNIPRNRSAIYVLVGLEGQFGPYAIGVGKDPKWAEMNPVSGVAGLFEFSCEAEEGPTLLSFQAKEHAPITFATHALPNRATLLSLSANAGPSRIGLYQFMLPIWNLKNELPQEVRSQIGESPLRIVRFIAQVERLFSRDRSLSKAFGRESTTRDEESKGFYRDLIESKWLDPIGSLVAAHDLLRRGVLNPKLNPQSPLSQFQSVFPIMVENFRKHFGRVPDAEALAKAIGKPWTVPTAPPLLADSLTMFSLDEQKQFMPFPNYCKHFDTPWVSWVNAVKSYF
jgi:hypothetical protein